METVSRRSVIGIAAGVIAGGMMAREAVARDSTSNETLNSEPNTPAGEKTDSPYKFRMATAHARHYGQSSIREHKLHDFPMSSSMSASLIHLATGDFREPHWHPNSDEWLFVMAGKIRMTVVDGKGIASSFDCDLEDVAFTPMGFGHYVENIGEAGARLMLIHNHADFTTVNLSEWVAAGSTSVFASTLKMPVQSFDDVPEKKVFIGRKDAKGE
jgi:oxalate decarboxylase